MWQSHFSDWTHPAKTNLSQTCFFKQPIMTLVKTHACIVLFTVSKKFNFLSSQLGRKISYKTANLS
jgi:hypothetical protein